MVKPEVYDKFMNKATGNKTDSLTSNVIDKIADLLDDRLIPISTKMATKEFVKEEISGVKGEMKNLETSLKQYIDEGVETIMKGIDGITERLAEKEKVERLERWARLAG